VDSEKHLDVNLAVNNFLKYFESLSRLPLITDAEMSCLFGEEINSVLVDLDYYNRQEKLCRSCASRCCQIIECEFYVSGLSRCPVYSSRPLLCRMHFCNQFSPRYCLQVKEIGDIFLESLLAAERLGSKKVGLFDTPPLGKQAPGLVAAVTPHIKAIREGRLDEPAALLAIQNEVDCFYGCFR
jgi:hypothetical protein